MITFFDNYKEILENKEFLSEQHDFNTRKVIVDRQEYLKIKALLSDLSLERKNHIKNNIEILNNVEVNSKNGILAIGAILKVLKNIRDTQYISKKDASKLIHYSVKHLELIKESTDKIKNILKR